MIVHDVEQRSPEWYSLRAGIPTASEFGKVVTSTGEPSKSAVIYARTLAAEAFAGKPVDAWEGSVWMERGRELEGRAIGLYEFAGDVEAVAVGFVTDDAKSMGCSPDALIGDDGLIEVKCLKAETHIETALYWRKHRKCPPTYVQQVQGQLMITGRAWCDIVFYHPELPMIVLRQEPDVALHMALTTALASLCRDRDEILAMLRGMSGKEAA